MKRLVPFIALFLIAPAALGPYASHDNVTTGANGTPLVQTDIALGQVPCKTLQNVRCVDAANSTGWSGKTPDAWITSAIANLPSGGGTVDARGLGAGSAPWASLVTIPQSVTVMMDQQATSIQPATSSQSIFKIEPGARVFGAHINCTGQTTWSGTLFQTDTNQLYNFQGTEMGNFLIDASCASAPGTAISLNSASANTGIAFLNIHDGSAVLGAGGTCFLLTSRATGFVNNNHFVNIRCVQAGVGWDLHGGGGAGITGNICSVCAYEANSNVSGLYVKIDGTGAVQNNVFFGNSWDNTTSVNISNTSAIGNSFFGYFNGGFTDTSGTNLNAFFPFGSGNGFQVTQLPYGLKVYQNGVTKANAVSICDSNTADNTPCIYLAINHGNGNGELFARGNEYTSNIWTLDQNGDMTSQALKIKDQGQCTMTSGFCPPQHLSHTYASAPQCIVTWTGNGKLTGILKAPSTKNTMTPESSVSKDTAEVNWICFGK
jgi:hypothetical protein